MATIRPVLGYVVPDFRVLYTDDVNASSVAEGGGFTCETDAVWTILTEPDPGAGKLDGVELLTCGRKSIPEVGKATFRMVYGNYPSGVVTPPVTLIGKTVRLQLKDFSGNWVTVFFGHVDYEEDSPLVGSPTGTKQGAKLFYCLDALARTMKWPMNRHGFDSLDSNVAGNKQEDAYGHPGYNYYLSADGPLMGNKSRYIYVVNTIETRMHIWQGAFATALLDPNYIWSDYEAINNALVITRPKGELWFALKEGFENYNSKNPLAVDQNENVFSFLSRVAGRKRGLGTVAVKWVDVVGGGDPGQIRTWLGVTPLNPVSISFQYIASGDTGQVGGASGYTDYVTGRSLRYQTNQSLPWDLRGDHYNIDPRFFIGTMEGQQYEYIEVVGERIEIGVTMSLKDTNGGLANIYDVTKQAGCAPRWSEADRNTVEGLTTSQRVMDRWRHVYQAFGLPRLWNGRVGCGLGYSPTSTIRADVRCKDDGSIDVPTAIFYNDTPGSSVELMSYIPFYQGFDYSGIVPRRTDNSPSNGMPDRRPAQVYLQPTATTEDRWFLPMGEFPDNIVDKFNFRGALGGFNPTIFIQPDSVQLISQQFQDRGLRPFADVARDATLGANNKLGALYDVTKLAVTLSLRLPYPLKFVAAIPSLPQVSARLSLYPGGYKDWQAARRKKTLYVPRAHLWLAHSNIIYDLQQTTITVEGWLAQRLPLGSYADNVVILRDDRDRVQFFFEVARFWYLNLDLSLPQNQQVARPRKRVSVTQSYCGLLPFQKIDPADGTTLLTDYPPQINDHIDTMFINGDADASPTLVGTNVTSVDYDHQAQTTTWGTDYFDLEFSV